MKKENILGITITKIAVKGFKSIADECEIEIRPLTILAGANSSGKSSIMQPLLMLKQTLEAQYYPGPLSIYGPNVKFTQVEQFLSSLSHKSAADDFMIRIETELNNTVYSVTTVYRKESTMIEIPKMIIKSKSKDPKSNFCFTLTPDMSPDELKLLTEQLDSISFSFSEIPNNLLPIVESIRQLMQKLVQIYSDAVSQPRCFLTPDIKGGFELEFLIAYIKVSIQSIIHLPGFRGNPERTYNKSGTGPNYLGTFENYVASVIYDWRTKKDEKMNSVTAALKALNLTGQVDSNSISDVSLDLQVGHLTKNTSEVSNLVSIADAGFGVSQVLPVIVALIAADPGQLVYIEQPELHLHPRAQVALAQVFADAAKRGVRIVAETHSSRFLLGIQTLVAEGELSPELVKLHWFSRSEEGITQVNSVNLDEEGAFGDWSVDFDDVDLNAESRYLDAVDKIRFGEEETE